MSKKLIATIAIIVVVALGIVAYVMTNKNSTKPEDTNSQSSGTQNSQSTSPSSQKGSIFTLVKSKKSQKCSFSYSGENGDGTGEMYTDGNDRGLMTMSMQTTAGNQGKMNILMLNEKVYTWTTSNGETFGMVFEKSAYASNSTAGTNDQASSNTASGNQEFDLKCEDWKVDGSRLAVPSDVDFTSAPTGN